MKSGKRLRMNHLCMEDNTSEEGSGGAATKGDPNQSAWLNDPEIIGTDPGKVTQKEDALMNNMRNGL